ncbi:MULTISPECIES: phosphodiester glycosidase family protein [Micromonospora]|uniref:phosphodiester glycosidase family protein n=1 Tax=Micromonospora TaxID=1873 RepID=UPI000D701C70|nr:phosphodiester glycosidase family protein [Micromonospora sp. S4605]PWU56470.1 multidrug transporter [Micromonospora sp. S4605]
MPYTISRRLGTLLASAGLVGVLATQPYNADNQPAVVTVGAQLPAAVDTTTSGRMETFRSERPVAPGVTLTTLDQYGPDGFTGEPNWLQSNVLSVDMTAGTRVDRIFPGRVASREPLPQMAERAGAVAAVNTDYFDISGSGAPWGVGIQSGELLHSPLPNTRAATSQNAVMFTEDGIGRIGEIVFEGTVFLPGGQTVPLDAMNKAELLRDQIQVFTPVWGTFCRCRATETAARDTEVVVVNGSVTEVSDQPRAGAIPDNGFVLVGREGGADRLAALEPGDQVRIDYSFRAPDDMRIKAAMSGRQLLVVDGKPETQTASNNTPEPRTAVGFSADGRRMWLITVDGRQPAFSRGIGLSELARKMVDLGAHTALNLDGGGSTTIVAREPGADELALVNRPSDGQLRPVPTGLAFYAPAGSGRLAGYWVTTKIDPERRPGFAYQAPLRPERVFPGLNRRLEADGYDETFGPTGTPGGAPVAWTSADQRVGTVSDDGVFSARGPGRTTVAARFGNATGAMELTVLGELRRLSSLPAPIAVTQQRGPAGFDVVGFDERGYSAPIDPDDVELTYDDSAIKVTVNERGQFEVTALRDRGSTVITAAVRGLTATIPVGIGLADVVVEDFEDADDWELFTLRATASMSTTEGGHSGAGMQLDFDFTQSNLTRGIGVWSPGRRLKIAGEPWAFKLWVNSGGWGQRARIEVDDALGTVFTLEPGTVNEPGWQQITYEVPQGVKYPLHLRRVYFNEVDGNATYTGRLVIDELTAVVPTPVEAVPASSSPDPLVAHGTAAGAADWRFAVLSDLGVRGDDPNGPAAQRARRALREIRDRQAALVVVNGGFVADGSAANLAFAHQLLKQELPPDVVYYYVPGEAELFNGSLATFEAEFGATPRVVDHGGIRFLLLDTTRQSYRGGDWTQLPLVRDQLAAASADKRVTSVVVAQNLPLRDPGPGHLSELTDRKEAATIEQMLTAFREQSGKAASLIAASAGRFHVERADGIPYVTNGPGKAAVSGAGGSGEFAGWSLWSVRPDAGPDGLRAEFVPQADSLTVDAPHTVPVGSVTRLDALIMQGGRAIPVRYPMAAVWTGVEGVRLGPASGAPPGYLASFDPSTGDLRALRPGTLTLALKVNTQTVSVRITVVE